MSLKHKRKALLSTQVKYILYFYLRKKLYYIYFKTIQKQVLQLISEPFVGTDISTRGSLMQRKPECPKKKPTCPRRQPPYSFTYNHCRSRISNSDRSGERHVHCPLLEHPSSYLMTGAPLLSYYSFFGYIRFSSSFFPLLVF